MRSAKMAELFESLGINCEVLTGGYKAYRQQLLNDVTALQRLIVLQGPTGSGKTDILHELQARGEQIIDLEGLANHRGSSFGGIGMEPQPSTQQFQNNLHERIQQIEAGKRVWVESESFRIGKVHLPEPFWEAMNDASLLQLDMPVELRAKRLVQDYGSLAKEALAEAIERLEDNFGKAKVNEAKELLQAGEGEALAQQLLLGYYDRRYRHSREKFKSQKAVILACHTANPAENAQQLIELANLQSL